MNTQECVTDCVTQSEIMPWTELSIDTTSEAIDWVCTLLGSVDYAGEIQIVERRADNALNSEDITTALGAFQVRLYLPADVATARITEIVNLLSSLHRTGLINAPEIAVVEERASKADNPLQRIGQRFVVVAPDAAYRSKADKIQIRLTPSLAFGSGLHPATILAMQLLERYVVRGMQALDLGSGTGILSVAMAKLGAEVLALDNDTTAVQATQATVQCNRVEAQVKVMLGSLGQGSEMGHWMGGSLTETVPTIQPSAAFDLIAANILARVHIALADDYRSALRRSTPGLLVMAGFTTDYENDINAALTSAGFEAIDLERYDEWVALAYRLDC